MEDSPVFYGYYSGTFVFDLYGVPYNFPLAYFLVLLSVFLLTIVALVTSSAKSFQASTLSIADSDTCHFVNMVLAGWDHGMTSLQRKDADDQKQSIAGRLKFEMEALQKLKQLKNMQRRDRWKLNTIRSLVWLLAVLSLSGLAIFMMRMTVRPAARPQSS